MQRKWLTSLMVCFAVFLPVGFVVWSIDRSETIKWVGDTRLQIDFLVSAADSNDPIPNARIEIRSEGGFYDGGFKEEPNSELQTDANGMAHRVCAHNRCIGAQSRLRFTDTYHVYIPRWHVRALAVGFKPSPWIHLKEDYHGKVEQEAPESDRLVVQITLRKVAGDVPAGPRRNP